MESFVKSISNLRLLLHLEAVGLYNIQASTQFLLLKLEGAAQDKAH